MAFTLSPQITAFPALHGKAVFAMQLRQLFWAKRFDCVAIALPACLQQDCIEGLEKLPFIHALSIHSAMRCYLPFDPCDAYIEAMRQASQRKSDLRFLEDQTLFTYSQHFEFPDTLLLQSQGLENYYGLCKPALTLVAPESQHRAQINYRRLKTLEAHYQNILWVGDFTVFSQLQMLFENNSISQILAESLTEAYSAIPSNSLSENSCAEGTEELEETPMIRLLPVKPKHLYFALGELPFYAGEMEKERQNVLASPREYLDLVKQIFIDTRNQYVTEGAEQISVKKLQTALTFLRNLAAMQNRITPDLMDLITAAKGVFGQNFAVRVLEAARDYPFIDMETSVQALEIGRTHIQEPQDEEPVSAFNLFQDEIKHWKIISLKKEPDKKQQQEFRYAWDPRGMCSHTPEDVKIENFNRVVRRRTVDLVQQGQSRIEKLTSSLKDGIDLRETLRHWHKRSIYVKDSPPTHSKLDTVVIIFDENHDDKYPQHTTWYAEHKEESTLTFYATDPFAKMIGPGITESQYGGLSLLFPPRPIQDVFKLFPPSEFQSLAEQLLYGALMHSDEKIISYVSAEKPNMRKRQMAKQFRKKLAWVPLQAFSEETLRQLRKFHILNGKEVRSWVGRYLSD